MAVNELENIFSSTLNGIRSMIDVNTIIGSPIEAPDGLVIIPVSKVAFGFGMGGWDRDEKEKEGNLVGGSGGGVTVCPVGFLIVGNGTVKMLNIDSTTVLEKAMDLLPDLIKSIAQFFGKSGE
ncbi:MAG: putative spore protein YtfJ [Firmicutes bacterium ADurb.Bin193]|nr:MAG: putative spore protein YtfJ [Firmicutes bacterium ADurb.Bin193]